MTAAKTTTNQETALEFVGWDPTDPLSLCQGDCDNDSDCEGDLVCVHDAVPEGCSGTLATRSDDYCGLKGDTVDAAAAVTKERVNNDSSGVGLGDWHSAFVYGAAGAALVIVAIVAISCAVNRAMNGNDEVDIKACDAVHVPNDSVIPQDAANEMNVAEDKAETTKTAPMVDVELVIAE